MKMKWMAVLAAACILAAGGCGKGGNQAAQGDESAKAAEATQAASESATAESASAKVADQSAVSTTDNAIVITGSGNGRVGPITLDKPYYIVKAKYASDDFSMLQLGYKKTVGGSETDDYILMTPPVGDYVRVFQVYQPPLELSLDIQSEGTYTIEFQGPPSLDAAQPAPQTVTGGQGYTMTPLVKTAGNYVMLRVKYTGSVDPGKVGGMPLAMGNLYDAVTGDNWVRNQSVYDHNIQSEDGATRPAPGVYFAIIHCGKDGGAWEATITE